jgi:thiol:disulfide interchange protein DsbD
MLGQGSMVCGTQNPMSRRAPAVMAVVLILLFPALAYADGGDFQKYQERGWLWMYLASFGFGFLTSLTPCVYPMIPIILAIFGARGKDVSKRRAIALATIYVTGMGLTYAVLGVAFAMLGGGTGFGTQLAKPYVVLPLVALFCALAASMLGAFDLNLPASWQARLNQVGGKGFRGAFAMGLVGGLIAAPCTGPFLAGLLAFVSTTGSVVGGGSLLFVYALGMGVLFWVIAAFAMSLPKSGTWMESVKSAGGVMMLVAALYFLRPLLPWMRTFASPHLWFLGVSLAVGIVGIALGAIHLSFHGSPLEKGRKGAGIALLLAGIFGVWTWKLTPKQHLPWVHDERLAYDLARAQHKGVMVDFAASWCTPCSEMELTFGDDDVYDAITQNFVPLQLDVSDDNADTAEKRKRYGADTLPSVVFMGVDSTPDSTIVGHVSQLLEPDAMLEVIRPAVKQQKALVAANPPSIRQIAWVDDEKHAFDQARTDHKGVLVSFDASWCQPCKELAKRVAALSTVIDPRFVPLKIDVTAETQQNKEQRAHYHANLPTLVFLSSDGTELARVEKDIEPRELVQVVAPVVEKLGI